MSEKADWQKLIIDRIGELLKPHDFIFVSSRRAFRRKTNYGSDIVHLALIQHPEDFDVIVNVAIRFDEVQMRIESSEEKRVKAATIGCEYGNLIGSGQHRWTIEESEDVVPAALDIYRVCRETLFPFFETYSDLRTVYDTLKKDGPDGWLLMPLHDKRKDIIDAIALILGI